MGKNKSNSSNQQKARASWAKGEKFTMLSSYKEKFLACPGDMYKSATNDFIDKWGYDLAPEVAPVDGIDYSSPDINTFAEGPARNAEIKRRAEFRKKLRKRVINWACYHFKLKHIKTDEKLVAMTCKTFRDLREDVPRKKCDFQRYQELHYQDRVKPEFDAYWQESGQKLVSGNHLISERNSFSKKKWESEDEEFVQELRTENSRIYAEDMAKYAARGEWKGTAEDFSDAWMRSKSCLAAFADTIAIHFGVAIIIFAAGPRDDGQIKTESISSIVPSAQTSLTFQNFNPEKYREIHHHCDAYAAKIFSQEECESRVFDRSEAEQAEARASEDTQPGWERFACSNGTSFTPASDPVITVHPGPVTIPDGNGVQAVPDNVSSDATTSSPTPSTQTPQPTSSTEPIHPHLSSQATQPNLPNPSTSTQTTASDGVTQTTASDGATQITASVGTTQTTMPDSSTQTLDPCTPLQPDDVSQPFGSFPQLDTASVGATQTIMPDSSTQTLLPCVPLQLDHVSQPNTQLGSFPQPVTTQLEDRTQPDTTTEKLDAQLDPNQELYHHKEQEVRGATSGGSDYHALDGWNLPVNTAQQWSAGLANGDNWYYNDSQRGPQTFDDGSGYSNMGSYGYTNGYQNQNSYGTHYNTVCYNGSLSNYTNGYGSSFNGSSNAYNSSLNSAVNNQFNYVNNGENHCFNAPPHSVQPALPKSTQTEQPIMHGSTQTGALEQFPVALGTSQTGALEQSPVALGTSQTVRSLTPAHTPPRSISPRPFTPTLLIRSHSSQNANDSAGVEARRPKRKRQSEEDALTEYAKDILLAGENGVKRPRRGAKLGE